MPSTLNWPLDYLNADMATINPGESTDRISFTLFLALAVHALLIFGVTFKTSSGDKIAPTLNITLATHKSEKAPEKADFLAQFDQQASGMETQARELTTVRQAEIADTLVRQVNPIAQQRKRSKTEINTQLITTSAKRSRQAPEPKSSEREVQQEEREGLAEDAPVTNTEYASLQAKLDRILEERAKQPRIRRLTSVATKSSYDAEYLNQWAEKIEFVGNHNFPESALRREIFGHLRLAVLLNPNGTIDQVEILQSSGHQVLDDAALQIVHLAAPFPPFPPEIRKEADKLDIIRTWRFEITGLSTAN